MFPVEFKECPVCKSEETICRAACKGEPSIPEGTFVSLEKRFTTVQAPSKLLGPLAKGILTHYDVCQNCGTSYCTKAEIIMAPVTFQQASRNPGRG